MTPEQRQQRIEAGHAALRAWVRTMGWSEDADISEAREVLDAADRAVPVIALGDSKTEAHAVAQREFLRAERAEAALRAISDAADGALPNDAGEVLNVIREELG